MPGHSQLHIFETKFIVFCTKSIHPVLFWIICSQETLPPQPLTIHLPPFQTVLFPQFPWLLLKSGLHILSVLLNSFDSVVPGWFSPICLLHHWRAHQIVSPPCFKSFCSSLSNIRFKSRGTAPEAFHDLRLPLWFVCRHLCIRLHPKCHTSQAAP